MTSPCEAHANKQYDHSYYEDAVATLYKQIDASMQVENRQSCVEEMREYMRRLNLSYQNYENDLLTGFKVVHVTGTKGKGSTCAFTESLLRNAYSQHTGMFTSPHLLKVNERIRLDGKPVSDKDFAAAYFAVRDILLNYDGCNEEVCQEEIVKSLPSLPGYFRMLTLVALYIFTHFQFDDGNKVDVVILEVGIGGRYDATNVYDSYAACGIAELGLDHTNILGNTLEAIAFEKGGIIKENSCDSCNTFTINRNTEGVISVLEACAQAKSNKIHVIQLGKMVQKTWKLGLKGNHQYVNAELAVYLTKTVMNTLLESSENESYDCTMKRNERIQHALFDTAWPGRCQLLTHKHFKNMRMYIDGAHTIESISCCLEWFSLNCMSSSNKILVFSCGHERNPIELIECISSWRYQNRNLFAHVFFCKPKWQRPSPKPLPSVLKMLEEAKVTFDPSLLHVSPEQTWQERLACLWRILDNNDMKSEIHPESILSDIFEKIGGFTIARPSDITEVCVVGSLYLAGSVLDELGFEEKFANGVFSPL